MIVDWNEVKHFKPYETECKCGCGKNDPDHRILALADKWRELKGSYAEFSSVCRCLEHNRNEGSKDTSSHAKSPCLAGDLEYGGKRERFLLLQLLIDEGITRIGIAKTFMHYDFDTEKAEEIAWLY